MNYSDAINTINANRDGNGFTLPSATKGIYFYKGSAGLAVKLNDDDYVVVDLDSLTAQYLLSYGMSGEIEIDSLKPKRYIDSKSRFNELSDIDKENVLLFLEDKYTEEYVCIKQHEDGLITVQDYQESEFLELSDKRGYVKRDKLLKNIYMLDYKDFKYKVSRKQGVAHTITVCDGTTFTVRNDESDSKDILYFHYGHAFHRTESTERSFAESILNKFPNARITITEQQIERRKVDKKDNVVTHDEFITNEYPMAGVCTGIPGYTIDNGRSEA